MQESTWLTLIEAAAQGRPEEREEFARRYEGTIRAYLLERWKGTELLEKTDDTVQDVFVECFRPKGIIDRFDPNQDGGFRAFLYGAVRNVARHAERRWKVENKDRIGDIDIDRLDGDDSSLSKRFDRAWAQSLMKQAAQRQRALAQKAGGEALQRVELLRLRFQENRPIRDIAALWNVTPDKLHHEYAKARQEFRRSLEDVVHFHCPATKAEVEKHCRDLLDLLQ